MKTKPLPNMRMYMFTYIIIVLMKNTVSFGLK